MIKHIKGSLPLILGITIGIIFAMIFSPEPVKSQISQEPEEVLTFQTTGSVEMTTSTTTQEVISTEPTSLPTTTPTTEEVIKPDNLPISDKFRSHVSEVCQLYNFDENLIYQIIYHESRFQSNADNGLCQGLMQVNKNYIKHYANINDGVYDISDDYDVFDPYDNVILGVRVLDDWRRMGKDSGYNKLVDWLSFYNQGWSYKSSKSQRYAKAVLNTDLSKIDFSNYKIVGD